MRCGLWIVMAAALLAAPLERAASQAPQTTGWRGDGTGRFPDAQPPTAWSSDSDNILWTTKVGGGYSSPVVTQGRVLITAQPSELICLDASNGAELWRRTADYAAALGADEAKRISLRQQQLDEEVQTIKREYDRVRKENPESPQLDELKRQRKEAEDRRREFERDYPPERRGGAGNAAATVACDGDRVFALFGTGVIGAFDLEGQQLWVRRFEGPEAGFGHSASPVLAAGHLIIHIRQLTALDPQSGETIWQTELPAKFGTPAITRIDGQDVLVTPAGALVRADNGQVLAQKQFQLSNNSPLIHDDVVYAHEGGSIRALRLPKSLTPPVTLELLWQTPGTRDQRMASAVYHDGLLYAGGRRGVIDVTDAATGESLYKQRTDVGELFASPSLAGGYVFYPGRKGGTLVLRPGPKYDEVAVNEAGAVSATPLFAGRRLYLRVGEKLHCIGR